MEKYVKAFQTQLSTMKTGKISANQLETIKVKLSTGETQPLKTLASIIVKSPKQIVISAYEKSVGW
jgi:ribosome recycling factor